MQFFICNKMIIIPQTCSINYIYICSKYNSEGILVAQRKKQFSCYHSSLLKSIILSLVF